MQQISDMVNAKAIADAKMSKSGIEGTENFERSESIESYN